MAPPQLTQQQQKLVEQVRKGDKGSHSPAELVALHTLARYGHLHVTHDDDGFHFTAPKQQKSAGGKSKRKKKG